MKFAAIPFAWMERHTAGAVRQGVSLESLLEKSLIELRYGDHRDVISPAQRILLCMNTVLAVEDATHGLARSGVGASYPAIGLRMALGCSNLEGAIQAISRLYALASSAVHIQLRTEDDVAILSVHMEATEARDVPYLEENFLIWVFIQILSFLGRPPPVFEVTLRDPLHFSIGRQHWGLQGPVRHGDVTSFRFSRKLLAEPPMSRAGDNVMWESHALWFAYLDGSLMSAPIAEGVVGGFTRFSDIVRDSGVSANTLRRHLKASGGGFRELRQRTLVEAASRRLAVSDESVETIAAELGYSDARSFRRFLKSATGLTPQQVRDRHWAEESREDDRVLQRVNALSQEMNI